MPFGGKKLWAGSGGDITPIGEDTLSFSNALRGALREDPDIILVGEMRDLETIEIALHAAETGRLVLSTLHTLDSKETINRVIGMFAKDMIMNYRDDEVQEALYGTQTFDQALLDMFNANRISEEEALASANNPDDLKIKIRGAIAEKTDAPKEFGVFKIKAAAG